MNLTKLKVLMSQGQKTYLNKTRMYLAPCMEYYGEDIIKSINDLRYIWCGIDLGKPYTILYITTDVNAKISKDVFFFKRAEIHSSKGLISYWLIIPKSMHQAYDKFLESKYSEMYTREQLEKIFINPDPRFGEMKLKELALPTLIKHPKRKEAFEAMINSWSSDQLDDTYITLPNQVELDTVWKNQHEILE